jgi:hypothetical protein
VRVVVLPVKALASVTTQAAEVLVVRVVHIRKAVVAPLVLRGLVVVEEMAGLAPLSQDGPVRVVAAVVQTTVLLEASGERVLLAEVEVVEVEAQIQAVLVELAARGELEFGLLYKVYQGVGDMRLAVIDSDNKVVNVIEAPADWAIEGYTLVASETAGPDDTYDGSSFIPPTVADPGPSPRSEWAAATTDIKLQIIGRQLNLED